MLTRDVQYFLIVAQEHTLARAAERLGISQPALSRAVQRLEAQYQVSLLERTARGVVISQAGKRLAARASLAAIAADDAAKELADIASGRRGDDYCRINELQGQEGGRSQNLRSRQGQSS